MKVETAEEILSTYDERKPSEIGNAVDILYKELRTYKAIVQQFGRSEGFWSVRHRIYQLPAGIRWKVDGGQISIDQSYQISRLENYEDQWLLAMVIIETENLTAAECRNVVDLVLKGNKSIREALSISAGIRFEKIQSLVLPLKFDIRLAICKRAWGQGQEWKDLAYQFILQGIDVDIKEVVSQLEQLTSDLRKAGETQQESHENEPENKNRGE